MRSVLFDTSVYIEALRHGDPAVLDLGSDDPDTKKWLSAVVLQELLAGATGPQRRVVEVLQRDFEREGRLLVPNLDDWVQTGLALAWMSSHYDYERIGRSRLTNDALIAMSGAREGITVVTANRRDFARLAEFRRFRWETYAL